MKPFAAVSAVVTAVLMLGVLPAAFANDMNASLVPESNKGEAHYIGVKNITLRYPAGSPIATEISKQIPQDLRITKKINGTIDSQDSEVKSAITAFNRALLDKKSPSQVTAIELTYTAVFKPSDTSMLISYNIQAVPLLEHFVLGDGTATSGNKIVDLEWRSIVVKEPINAELPNVGAVDINRALGPISKLLPDVSDAIEKSSAASIFDDPILDFSRFDQKMDSWHFLFDPSGSLVETSAFFREGTGAKVVSIYSLGESSFREGTFEPEEKDASATVSGAELSIHSQVPAPSGQVQIAGFSTLDVSQPDAEIATVSADAPAGAGTATGSFPIQVLLVFGGMMGAIAIFILFKARK